MTKIIREKSEILPLVAEAFRALGYEGASFSRITKLTGISKGSLFHFFPGGKEQMAAEILVEINNWFVTNIYLPLETGEPMAALSLMWAQTGRYFHSGGRVCLVGAFAMDATRDYFQVAIHDYFTRWIQALACCLGRAGVDAAQAAAFAEQAVLNIQGGLVLARAVNDEAVFARTLQRLAAEAEALLACQNPPR
ncbi:MAG: TetR/AcrR family transcriptional regulator [Rhodospirillales bacterium]|nr:TetR/AcrR family transcriptional regulator [Rhodospirillales bacterium]MDE2319962.1 TetR/AcrR family transcriptional regulator [Rhodospirillales bacterium]